MSNLHLILIVAIFISTLLVSLKKLKYGLFVFVLLSPLMHKEFFSLGIWDLLPIRVSVIGFGLAALIRFIGWYTKTSASDRKNAIIDFVKKDPFLILLTLLWLTRAFSLVINGGDFGSAGLFGFFSSVLLVYTIFRKLLDKYGEALLNKIIYIYLGLGFATGVFALVQYYLRLCCRKTIGGVWVVPGYIPRLGSTFWDVNHYGGFLITLIPIFTVFLFFSKKIWQKLLFSFGAIFMGYLLFMTQSRSSWIGLLAGLAIAGIILQWNKLRKPIILMTAACILGLASVLAYTSYQGISLRDKAASYMHYRLDSTDTHVMLLKGATEVFLNNFVIGAGYGNFDTAFRNTETASDYFDREPKLRDMKVPPHSVWGEVLAETGAVGIVVYALFSVAILASLIAAVFEKRNERTKYLGIGLLWSVFSIFAAGIFYSYNMEFFWIILFMAIGYIFTTYKDKWSFAHIVKWWYDKRITPYLIIIPPAFFYIFLKLGDTTLIDWDEAIYAKVARNIVETGQWLSLRWDDVNDYWFEKPPLYMWLTALTFKITNFNSLGARFVSAVFGFAGVILTYKFGEKIYNKLVGIFAALILLSTVHYLYYSRNGTLDVTVTFFITLTLYLFYLGLNRKKSSAGGSTLVYFILAGAAMGFGVMTKAVIGLLPIPIIAIYLLIDRPKEKAKLLRNLMFFGLAFLVTAAPWHIYSVIVHGEEFVDDYFIDHMLGRGLSGFGHEKPVWWFLEVIKVSFRIWVLPLIGGLVALPFIDRKENRKLIFLSICTFFVLVFFSVSKDKLLWYIMPIYPFIAIISARFLERVLVVANSVLKNEVEFDYSILRSISLLVIFVTSIFYVVIMRDRIYYPDFNRDKVALVKIHNQLYPIKDYPDRKLYYDRIAPPVLLFYSDHQVKHAGEEEVLRKIDNAEPAENFSFLLPNSVYYSITGEQKKIEAPLVLNVKGAAGEWILVKSESRVELLRGELSNLQVELRTLEGKDLAGTITPLEKEKLGALQARYVEIIAKLTAYGYPPF